MASVKSSPRNGGNNDNTLPSQPRGQPGTTGAMTERQRRFAAKNHNLIYRYLHEKGWEVSEYPRIWFGFPDRAFTCTFPEDCYTSGISQRYYELGGPASGFQRSDFFYYDVPSSQMCDLGWYTVFRGQEFLICEKWAKLERGELLFTYRLGKPGLGYGRKQYNDKISGMTALGEVLSTERETVRLKLDIDEGWNPGGPYPYTWRPETGNMMYCMPQVGTRVSLYFPNYDEQAAIAVNCVRTNGSSCARMSDPSRRSFVTEHGKEMNLYPQEMSFLGGASGTVKLEDETGITISTDKKIQIVAQQTVQVNGQTVAVSAPTGELVLAKGNTFSGKVESNMIQSNRYDLLSSSTTHIEGWVCLSYSNFEDAPIESTFNIWDVAENVLAGLAMVAVVAGGIALAAALTVGSAGAAAPLIYGAIALGVSNVLGQAFSDISNQTVSDTSVYRLVGLRGAMVGAISGGLGAMAESTIGVTLSLSSKMGLMGLIGSGQTWVENTLLGQVTDPDEMLLSFLLSAGLYGVGNIIGENWPKIRNGIKSVFGQTGQDTLENLDNAGRQFDHVSDDLIEQTDSAIRTPEINSNRVEFSSWDDMKDAYPGTVTKFVKENKPPYSRDIQKWFERGGSIVIENVDGHQIWTYVASTGEAVPYVDGYILFPSEYLHPEIESIDIGNFTGDRNDDLAKMLEILEDEYGLSEIPDGYVVHHHTENGILQLVEEEIHTMFTHIGGHSLYK